MGCFRLFVQIYVGIGVFIYICGTIAGVLSGAGFPLIEAVGNQIFIFLTFSMAGGITYLNLTREDLNLPPKERNQVKFAAFRKCVKIYLGRVDICVIIVICQHSPYLIGNGQK